MFFYWNSPWLYIIFSLGCSFWILFPFSASSLLCFSTSLLWLGFGTFNRLDIATYVLTCCDRLYSFSCYVLIHLLTRKVAVGGNTIKTRSWWSWKPAVLSLGNMPVVFWQKDRGGMNPAWRFLFLFKLSSPQKWDDLPADSLCSWAETETEFVLYLRYCSFFLNSDGLILYGLNIYIYREICLMKTLKVWITVKCGSHVRPPWGFLPANGFCYLAWGSCRAGTRFWRPGWGCSVPICTHTIHGAYIDWYI